MGNKIILHGSLKEHIPEKYNGVFECVFNTAKEAVSAIDANWPGFWIIIRNMDISLVIGDPKTGTFLGEDNNELSYNVGNNDLHIMPALEGSGGDTLNTVKTISGAALGALGLFKGFTNGFGSDTGLGLSATAAILGGASLLYTGLSPAPELDDNSSGAYAEREPVDATPSAIYRGPLNTQIVGQPMPLVYGVNIIAGGVLIHTDIMIEKV